MPFVTDGSLKQSLADTLKQPVEQLAPHWAPIVSQANERAQRRILNTLLGRGFTAAHVEAWDDLEAVHRDLALYYALRRGGAYAGYDEQTVASFNREADLKVDLLQVNGVWVKPVGDMPGLVTTAGPSAEGGMFNFPVPGQTPYLGDELRW